MPRQHKVKQGECLSSIAEKYGLFPETIADDGANADLKNQRKDLNVLYPGDVLTIPDKRKKEVSCGTEKRHRFRKKGTPAQLRLKLLDEDDSPRANVKYSLQIEGRYFEGSTDGEGKLEQTIPPGAKKAVLMLEDDDPIPLDLGHLDPVDTITGVQQRLRNLGYECNEETGDLDDGTISALKAFQKDNDLEESGEPDQTTKDKLVEKHGA